MKPSLPYDSEHILGFIIPPDISVTYAQELDRGRWTGRLHKSIGEGFVIVFAGQAQPGAMKREVLRTVQSRLKPTRVDGRHLGTEMMSFHVIQVYSTKAGVTRTKPAIWHS